MSQDVSPWVNRSPRERWRTSSKANPIFLKINRFHTISGFLHTSLKHSLIWTALAESGPELSRTSGC
jgi:hypothetical protein